MTNNQYYNPIDQDNTDFWSELCGTGLAESIGMNKNNKFEKLQEFDKAYLDYYPYLRKYVDQENLISKKILEIGLGYGTLGELLARQRCDYFGVDITPNAVEIMKYRLQNLGKLSEGKVVIGTALQLPFSTSEFDFVYSIGCLHHTGNVQRAISEIYRVLRPGGKAVIMLYNKNSLRLRVQAPYIYFLKSIMNVYNKSHSSSNGYDIFQRSLYDTNSEGKEAPLTEYFSKQDVYKLFNKFSNIKIEVQNIDSYSFVGGKFLIDRKMLLNNIAKITGLDLYIQIVK